MDSYIFENIDRSKFTAWVAVIILVSFLASCFIAAFLHQPDLMPINGFALFFVLCLIFFQALCYQWLIKQRTKNCGIEANKYLVVLWIIYIFKSLFAFSHTNVLMPEVETYTPADWGLKYESYQLVASILFLFLMIGLFVKPGINNNCKELASNPERVDVASRLEGIRLLLQKGLISQTEFDGKRRQILEEI